MSYNPREFSKQQLMAADDAITCYLEKRSFWTILLAQMQSGKTDTFMLVACEMVRLGLVNHVVIFSGNSETELRDQLLNNLTDDVTTGYLYWEKYRNYLRSLKTFDPIVCDIDSIASEIRPSIHVVWGSQLLDFNGPCHKTLFIWEEAHYAQSLKQRPDAFLRKIGVSGAGTNVAFEENGNYMMSVSATPFSELSNNIKKRKGENAARKKHVIKMFPSNGYVSIKQIRDSGNLVAYGDLKYGLRQALNMPNNGKQWAVIRITKNNEEDVIQTVTDNGWNHVIYDSSVSKRIDTDGYQAWNNMNHKTNPLPPDSNTAILIRGMCRMGKNVKKDHTLFFFETSKSSKTDTVLQSLLGRACGYSSKIVHVYLHSNIIKNGDIDKYIKMWDSNRNKPHKFIPKHAMNIVATSRKDALPIIPIRITVDDSMFVTSDDDNMETIMRPYVGTNKKMLIRHIGKQLISKDTSVVNHNPDEVYDKVVNMWEDHDEGYTSISLHCIDNMNKTINEEKGYIIHNAFEHKRNIFITSHNDSKDPENKHIHIWCLKNDDIQISGFEYNTFYVTANIVDYGDESDETETDDAANFTNRTEAFAYELDYDDKNESNHIQLRLTKETATSVSKMEEELYRYVSECISDPHYPKHINICDDNASRGLTGINVNAEVLAALTRDGMIHKRVKHKYGFILKYKKMGGKAPAYLKENALTRLHTISW